MPNAGDFLSDIAAQQHQSMLMRMLGNQNGSGAESLAGMAMSRGAAVGGPLASSALGMMGISPIGLGLMAGAKAWAVPGMGLSGALGVGMGVMGAASAVGAGVGLVGHQMMTGAQQQLGLNSSLRNNFNFMNQQGGMGFTGQQGFQIGESLRSMAGVMGPSGEVSTFGELSRLSAEMGRMGMAQNVRTVKEFKEKFKQMVDTLKVVAHDLGTSLEEAQKAMASMKSSGVFRSGDVTRMTGEMRVGALAGGLAMSEMSGAASIGSQISRSVGGTGRQGAFAGIKTMEMLGIAQRTGALNEEDIYNATGLTGAEGRQALAASQMQHSSSFLKTSRGRYFLASVAGKDGQLNQEAVAEWLSGGNMGTGRTAQLAQQNLGGVGRANFIRNEGRLRGASLEQFGGILQSMAYKQWLSQRGWDPSSMDDRAKIAFQNFSGMGRDEADVALKEIDSLPEQIGSMQDTKRGMIHSDALAMHRNKTGIIGIKRKFDEVKEHIQGRVQAVGARVLESLTDQIESYFNKQMGVYEDVTTEGLTEIARATERGGSMKNYERYFGKNVGAGGGSRGTGYAALQDMKTAVAYGSRDPNVAAFGAANADAIRRLTLNTVGKPVSEQIAAFKSMVSDGGNIGKVSMNGTEAQNAAVVESMQRAAGVTPEGFLSKAINKQAFEYSPQGRWHSRKEREEAIGRSLLGAPTALAEAPFMAAWAGAAVGVLTTPVAASADFVMGMKDIATVDLKNEKEVQAAGDRLGTNLKRSWGKGGLVDTITEFLSDPVSAITGSVTGEDDPKAKYIGRARIFSDKSTMADVSALFEGGPDGKKAAQSIEARLTRIGAGTNKPLSALEKAEYRGLGEILIGQRFKGHLSLYGGDVNKTGLMKEAVDAYREMMQYHPEVQRESDATIANRIWGMTEQGKLVLEDQQFENSMSERARMEGDYASGRASAVSTGFIGEGGELTASAAKDREKMTAAQQEVDKLAQQLTGMNPVDSDPQNLSGYGKRLGTLRDTRSKVAAMSLQEKISYARTRAGTEVGDYAAEYAQLEQRFDQDRKGAGGSLGAVAKRLGFKGDDDFLNATKFSASIDDPTKRAAAITGLLGKHGINDEAMTKAISEALATKGPDGATRSTGTRAKELDLALRNAGSEETQKKLRAIKEGDEEANNPMLKPLRDLLAESKTQTLHLQTIANQPHTNAEGVPGTPTKPAPQVVGCLAGSTSVSTSSGSMPIASLVATQDDVEVRTGKSVPTTTKSYGMHDLLEVVLSDGQVFHATKWHPWPCLRDGVETPGCFTPELVGAQMYNGDLTPGPLVLSVLPTGRVEEVFCCKVEAPSHTFVIGNNILTGSA